MPGLQRPAPREPRVHRGQGVARWRQPLAAQVSKQRLEAHTMKIAPVFFSCLFALLPFSACIGGDDPAQMHSGTLRQGSAIELANAVVCDGVIPCESGTQCMWIAAANLEEPICISEQTLVRSWTAAEMSVCYWSPTQSRCSAAAIMAEEPETTQPARHPPASTSPAS